VIDAGTVALVQDVIRREGRSLLQYVREAYPWATPRERELLAKLRELTDEEQDGAAALSDFLRRNREMSGYLGSYPTSFARMNFISLDRLLPLLVGEQRNGVARLEKTLAGVQNGEARGELKAVLERKRRHLKSLEELAALDTTPGTVR
jgi:hypothetical protein